MVRIPQTTKGWDRGKGGGGIKKHFVSQNNSIKQLYQVAIDVSTMFPMNFTAISFFVAAFSVR